MNQTEYTWKKSEWSKDCVVDDFFFQIYFPELLHKTKIYSSDDDSGLA